MNNIKDSLARFLHRLGISADFLTYSGLLLAFISAWFVYRGSFASAGVFLLFSGILDLLDGAVARASGKAGKFGGVLDSSLDRYGDAAVLGGALFFFTKSGQTFYAALSLSALCGSFLISYVRARAECAIPKCKVGFWERGERISYLCLGLLTGNLKWVIIVLALFTHLTAFQRLLCTYWAEKGIKPGPGFKKWCMAEHDRARISYFIKAVFWILLALFVRIS